MPPNATIEMLAQTAVGRTIESVARRGKYVIVGLTGEAYLVLHRKMSGNLVLRTTDLPIAAPHPPDRHPSTTAGGSTSSTHASSGGSTCLGRDALDAFLDERLGPSRWRSSSATWTGCWSGGAAA